MSRIGGLLLYLLSRYTRKRLNHLPKSTTEKSTLPRRKQNQVITHRLQIKGALPYVTRRCNQTTIYLGLNV
jgi:hypothetical protein